MSCRRHGRNSVSLAAIVTVLLGAMTVSGCGRKGPPLPPLREPDPVAETAAAEDAQDEAVDSEAEDAAADDDEGAADDDGTPP